MEEQQHEGPSDEEGHGKPRSKSKKRKAKLTTVEVLAPTQRERSMADAYGGQAVG
jgi:hypothetical protein